VTVKFYDLAAVVKAVGSGPLITQKPSLSENYFKPENDHKPM